ncbi:MAG: hypothetical protein ACLT0Y_04685 [Christensenellales bacterium]
MLPLRWRSAAVGKRKIAGFGSHQRRYGQGGPEGFADKADTAIVVCYPNDGVSPAQRLQMVTQKGDNVCVTAVEGNFDDCQNGVKRLMGDRAFHKMVEENGYTITSANSINFGRLVPQIVYYFTSYAELLRRGEIQLVNCWILSCRRVISAISWPAGMPDGVAGRGRFAPAIKQRFERFLKRAPTIAAESCETTSPSMDILISSHLERLLFELTEKDPEPIRTWMEQRAAQTLTVEENLMEKAREDLCGLADDKAAAIGDVFAAHNVLLIRTALWGISISTIQRANSDHIAVYGQPVQICYQYCPLWAIRQMGGNRPPKPWRRLPANRCRRPFDLFTAEQKHFCVAPEELDNLVKNFAK